jgi:hypothetical protein
VFAQKLESNSKVSTNAKENLDKRIGALENLERDEIKNESVVKSLEEKNKIITKSQKLLNTISNELRSNSLGAIEGIVTSAIKEVFQDKDIKFCMEMNSETSKPALKTFVKEGEHEFDLLEGRGLGMSDLVSTALRVCIKSIYKPKIGFPIILDEHFKFLHGENKDGSYPKAAFKFLKKITSGLDEQLIFITGVESKDFVQVADKIFHIEREDGKQVIREIE